MSDVEPELSPSERIESMGEELFVKMQTPEAREGVRSFFSMSPEELAAIATAVNEGTLKTEIDEAVGHDPDLAI